MLALLICIILRGRNFCGADVFLRFFNSEFELFGGGSRSEGLICLFAVRFVLAALPALFIL